MLPVLNAHGLLPDGIHTCTFEEAAAAFASSGHRQALWSSFMDYVGKVQALAFFGAIYVDGSFVTDTALPKDIDAVLLLPAASPETKLRLKQDAGVKAALDHDEVKKKYLVDIYSSRPPNIVFVEFFQRLRTKEALDRGLPPTAKRGILRVKL